MLKLYIMKRKLKNSIGFLTNWLQLLYIPITICSTCSRSDNSRELSLLRSNMYASDERKVL